MFEPAYLLSVAVALCAGIAWGWYLWGAKAKDATEARRELEDELHALRRKTTTLEKQHTDGQAEVEARGARVSELETELKQLRAKASDPEALAGLRRDLDQARRHAEKAKTDLEAAEKARDAAEARAVLAETKANEAERRAFDDIERQRKQSDAAKTKDHDEVERLKDEAEAARARAATESAARLKAELDAAKTIKTFAERAAKLKAEAEAMKARAEAEAARAMADMEHETKAKVSAEVIEIVSQPETDPNTNVEREAQDTPTESAANQPPPGIPDAYFQRFGHHVPMAKDGERDDLVSIKGIGPVTAKRLNDLGIFTFEQIAAFDLAILEQVIEAVGAIPARVHKDDWIGQAKTKIATR